MQGTTQNTSPAGVPTKFDTDGNVRHFPGNTIVCHLAKDDALQAPLMSIYQELEAERPDILYTLLPPASWHMTVFDGVCDQVRGPDLWPTDLAPDASLEDCNKLCTEKLSTFKMDIETPLRLRVAGVFPRKDGIRLDLVPVDSAEESRIRGLRDRLSQLLGIRRRNHETYGFHISMAYFIRHPTDEERGWLDAKFASHLPRMPSVLELGAPEFCLFDDMFEFRRQFFLK